MPSNRVTIHLSAEYRVTLADLLLTGLDEGLVYLDGPAVRALAALLGSSDTDVDVSTSRDMAKRYEEDKCAE